MFEQQLFNEDAAEPAKAEPGDLLYNYEIKTWDLNPRIYKILAVSAIANILALVVVAQTNMLTMRGCDSPFVGRVCQVLDTVYVGKVLLGTEREYIDAEYDRIDLGEADITMIDVSNMEAPLSYPEGYFQIANPEQFAAMQAAANNPTMGFVPPGVAPNPTIGPDMLNTQPILPKPNKDAVKGNLPDSLFEVEGENPTTANGGRKGGKKGNTKPDPNQTASNSNTNTEPKADPTAAISGVEINTRPMVDLGNYVIELKEKNEVNLESEFEIAARGKLDKTGKLDRASFRFINASSTDEKLIEVVKESIEAVNVAGYLQYLEQLSGKDLELFFKQDAENISALIQSEMESETRAQAVKTWLQIGLDWTRSKKEAADADQNDKDDLELLKNATIEVQGKKVVINFAVPKTVAHPMIQRKLAELAAEAKKPSGNAMIKHNDNTAAR